MSCIATVEYLGQEFLVDLEKRFWDGDTLVLPLESGGELRLVNPYWSKLSYDGLDFGSNETVTIVGNNKEWPSSTITLDDGPPTPVNNKVYDDSVEGSLERVLDGYPLIYHLATKKE